METTSETSTDGQQVTPSFNGNNFMSHLRTFFAGKTSFIKELLQNARRAGASQIDVQYDRHTGQLIVTDDGCGIGHWPTLVAILVSGWSEEIKKIDKPYGMGILSYFFASTSVTFQSGGKNLTACMADFEQLKPINVVIDPSAPAKGTRVTLSLLPEIGAATPKAFTIPYDHPQYEFANTSSIAAEFSMAAAGFPVPVKFNGTELLRSNAVDGPRNFRPSPIGMVCLGDDNERSWVRHYSCIQLYLQGLPIGRIGSGTSTIIAHLDSELFTARMPDRDTLYHHEEAHAKIQEAIAGLVRARLAELRKTMPPEQFVRSFWDTCLEFKCVELLDQTDCVPNSVLFVYEAIASESNNCTSPKGSYEATTTSKADLQALGARLWWNAPMSTDPDYCDSDAIRNHTLALVQLGKAANVVGVNLHKVPQQHWLRTLALDLEQAEISYKVVNAKRTGESIDEHINTPECCRVDFSSCDAINMVVTQGDKVLSWDFDTSLALEACFVDGSDDVVVCFTPLARGLTDIEFYDAFSTFRDSNDYYQESDRDEAIRLWKAVADVLFCNSLLDLVTHSVVDVQVANQVSDQAVLVLCANAKKRTKQQVLTVDFGDAAVWQAAAEKLNLKADVLKATVMQQFQAKARKKGKK